MPDKLIVIYSTTYSLEQFSRPEIEKEVREARAVESHALCTNLEQERLRRTC